MKRSLCIGFLALVVLALAAPSWATCPPNGVSGTCGLGCSLKCNDSTGGNTICDCEACSNVCTNTAACALPCEAPGAGEGNNTTCLQFNPQCNPANTPPCESACNASASCNMKCVTFNGTNTTCTNGGFACRATPTPPPPPTPTPPPPVTGLPAGPCGPDICKDRCGTVICEIPLPTGGTGQTQCASCPTPTVYPQEYPSPPPSVPFSGTPVACEPFKCNDPYAKCGPWPCTWADGRSDTMNCPACQTPPVGPPANFPDYALQPGCSRPTFHVSTTAPVVNADDLVLTLDGFPLDWKDPVFYVKVNGLTTRYDPAGTPGSVTFRPSQFAWYTITVVASPVHEPYVPESPQGGLICLSYPVNAEAISISTVEVAGGPPADGGPQNCTCTPPRVPKMRNWLEPRYITNATKGDGLVMSNPGFVGQMLSALRYRYSHAAMVTGDRDTPTGSNWITEFTSIDEEIKLRDHVHVPIRGSCYIDPDFLDRLTPGHRTMPFDQVGSGMHGIKVIAAPDALRDDARRAADYFQDSMGGPYRMSSFSLMPVTDGGTCSNTIAAAWNAVRPGSVTPVHMSAQFRHDGATYVQDALVKKATEVLKVLVPFYANVNQDECASQLANQITNCFANLGCDRTDLVWDSEAAIGAADSVGPDALYQGGKDNVAPYLPPQDAILADGIYHEYPVCEMVDDPADWVRPTCH